MTIPLETREDAYRDVIRSGRIKMLLLLLVCAAPVIASYFTFYVIKPQTRSNYGELILPVTPLPAAQLRLLDGKPYAFSELKGKWLLLGIDDGACAQPCQDKLFKMRQLRLMQGKEQDRLERVWLIDNDAQLETQLIRAYDGMFMLRAGGSPLLDAFPAATIAGASRRDHIYLIDPLGNLVLRYPKDADPQKMKKDLERLLRYSRIG
jgi:cytochrome oxidase Cu insertion factor (SCO1/SenC/PrrC family)